jgi:hypothetical protein
VEHGAALAVTQEAALDAAERADCVPLTAELLSRVGSAIRLPWRFKPPLSSEKRPDRDPTEGLAHKLSIGDIGAEGCYQFSLVQEARIRPPPRLVVRYSHPKVLRRLDIPSDRVQKRWHRAVHHLLRD